MRIPSFYSKVISKGSGFGLSSRECCRTKFIKSGSLTDLCQFYIAKTKSGLLKYGISSNILAQGWHKDYDKVKVVYEDYRLVIADLEYLVKCNLNTRSEYLEFNYSGEFREAFRNAVIQLGL